MILRFNGPVELGGFSTVPFIFRSFAMKKFLMLALVVGSFSLMGADYASAATGCRCNAAPAAAVQPAAPAASTAQAPTTQGRRSFSVEPGTAGPIYRAPMMRSFRAYGPTNPSFDAGRKIRGAY
jgi:hypothetical protein